MTSWLSSIAVCCALIAGDVSGRTIGVTGGRTNGDVWGTAIVPGGFRAIRRALELQGPLEDWRTIPLVIELSYRGPEGLRVARNLETYAAALRTIQTQGRAIGSDRVISLASGSARASEFAHLLDALGLEFESDRRKVRVKPGETAGRRVQVLTEAGLPMNDIVDRLNSGESVSLETRDGMAPLPLGTAFWERRFEPVPPAYDMLWAILANREMASLYYGLLALDSPTLQVIAANPKLESALVTYALILPTVAATLRIEDGVVRTPGGRDAAHLWQDLVGKSVDQPAEFVKALLPKDEGRLAYFYASIAALPAQSRAWVMRGSAGDAQSHRKAFRRLYEAFRSALGDWRPNALFPPPRHTPADALLAFTVTERGTLAGPPWGDFWPRALGNDRWPADPAGELGDIGQSRAADAAEILAAICASGCDPARLGAFELVQRELPEPSTADAPRLVLAVRARMRYPALALEIERMELGDVDVYRHLGGLAAKIDGLDSSDEAVSLVQFQAAVAMLARVRALGAPAEWVRERIRSLADLPLSGTGFDGALVRWFETSLFPTEGGEDPAHAVLRVLSGHRWQKPGEIFEWEGLRYRVDIAAKEHERIREVREGFSANTLVTASRLVRLADDVAGAVKAGQLESFENRLREIAEHLEEIRGAAWTGVPSTFDGLRDLPGEVMGTLRRARPQDAESIQRANRLLRRAADIVAADAAIALVYACALQDPNSPFAMSRELPRKHRLRIDPTATQKWTPWSMPFVRQSGDAAAHIVGALVALDAGVPRLSVRRISSRRPEQEPNLAILIADSLWRTAALHAPWRVSEEDIGSLDEARQRGATLVEGWGRDFDERILDRTGIAGPRAGWLRWGAVHGAIDPDILRLEDLVRLGSDGHILAARWGAAHDISGCLCVGMPPVSGELRSPAEDTETAGLRIVEGALRVAQELRLRRAPAALAPGVLMLLTAELVDNAIVPFPTDGQAVVGMIRQVPSSRFDDYVAAVAARGPLVLLEEVER